MPMAAMGSVATAAHSRVTDRADRQQLRDVAGVAWRAMCITRAVIGDVDEDGLRRRAPDVEPEASSHETSL